MEHGMKLTAYLLPTGLEGAHLDRGGLALPVAGWGKCRVEAVDVDTRPARNSDLPQGG
ncbi:MAG: hypothetical protein QOG21_692 [Actinomycetota bacterium]|nr:hypothetical protein [Actinomycetota bacterium]